MPFVFGITRSLRCFAALALVAGIRNSRRSSLAPLYCSCRLARQMPARTCARRCYSQNRALCALRSRSAIVLLMSLETSYAGCHDQSSLQASLRRPVVPPAHLLTCPSYLHLHDLVIGLHDAVADSNGVLQSRRRFLQCNGKIMGVGGLSQCPFDLFILGI